MNTKQIAPAIRFWCDKLETAVVNHLDLERNKKGAATAEPAIHEVLRGASIVVGVSLMERLIMDVLHSHAGGVGTPHAIEFGKVADWSISLGLNTSAALQAELGNFIRLRHCFAHEYGRATARQKKHIKKFLADLAAGNVIDSQGNAVLPYYALLSDDTIELQPDALKRFRLVVAAILRELSAKSFI